MSDTTADLATAVHDKTVASSFVEAVDRFGARTALRWKQGDDWRTMSWTDYGDRVSRVAAGLRERGVKPGDRVVLMMRNIPEFHVIDMAVYFCGATPVSIYNSSSPEQIEYLVGHCKAVLVIVENAGFLRRFDGLRGSLPALREVGIVDGEADFSLADLLAAEPIDLAAGAKQVQTDDLATVIYTSGTTGPPKGVMLTHYNVVFTVESLRRRIEPRPRRASSGVRIYRWPTSRSV